MQIEVQDGEEGSILSATNPSYVLEEARDSGLATGTHEAGSGSREDDPAGCFEDLPEKSSQSD